MAERKYEHYVKKLKFRDGPGYYRQVATLDGKDLGLDAHIEYGAYWLPGNMGSDAFTMHKHDYNKVMLWLGADPADMGELGAEVELILGEEGEKHMITTSTAVFVPAGMPHFPANIIKMDKRFVFMTVSVAPKCKDIPLPVDKEKIEKAPVLGFQAKYRNYVVNLAFTRKGAWSYGPTNHDDSGGSLSRIQNSDCGFDFLIMYEDIKKTPYRFGPNPDKPHVHPKPEVLFFTGTDLNDLSKLNGEVEFYLGKEKEMERYVITEPTAVVVPDGLAHCPLYILRADKPITLTDVRPFGSPPPVPGKL